VDTHNHYNLNTCNLKLVDWSTHLHEPQRKAPHLVGFSFFIFYFLDSAMAVATENEPLGFGL
jgi:hypothetical protein